MSDPLTAFARSVVLAPSPARAAADVAIRAAQSARVVLAFAGGSALARAHLAVGQAAGSLAGGPAHDLSDLLEALAALSTADRHRFAQDWSTDAPAAGLLALGLER